MSVQQIETRRIAALLGVAETELAFLADRPAAALTALREQIGEAGTQRHGKTFERLSRASGLLPSGIVARIARDVLGPELVAQLTPFQPLERVAQIAPLLEPAYHADVSVHMVPSASAAVLGAFKPELRAAVTRELLARREFAVMGTVVDYLPVDIVAALSEVISEPSALLNIATYVEDKSRLSLTVAEMPDDRARLLLDTAAAQGCMPVLCELVAVLEPAQQRRLAPLLQAAAAPVLAAWREAWDVSALGADPLLSD